MSRQHPYQDQIKNIKNKIADNKQLLADSELKELAQKEISKLEQQLKSLQAAAEEYQQALAEQKAAQQDPTRQSNAILELRAGAGGDEAKIWARDLLRMYSRYCQNKNLKIEFIDELVVKISGQAKLELTLPDLNNQTADHKNDQSPASEQTAVKKKFYPFQLLKHEAGVHRVQRVPTTETQGRIHTSTASVAVLPELKATDIEIKDEDLEWEFMRSSGAGGQSVNKTNSAVRLIHKPSDIMVRVSQERTQLKNRAIALDLLRSQLWAIEEEKRMSKIKDARSAIGRNMRAEKIRTYNFPQNRVTDHRISTSWHQLENILEGELDPVIAAVKSRLMIEDQTEEENKK